MESNDKVYMLVMRFQKNRKDGGYEKENSGVIHYSMETALAELQEYLKNELWYFKNYDRTSERACVKDLIYSMKSDKCSCQLFVNEYSCRRQRYFSQSELYQKFQEVITQADENLYEDLLALVDHQRYYISSFGEITRVVTVPQKITGKTIGVGTFTRADCKNGFYGGDFKYLDGNLTEEAKEYDGKLYFGSVNLLRKNIDENNYTGWERYKECFYSEEEALQGALSFYKDRLGEYIPDGIGNISDGLLKEIAQKKVIRNYISVEVVSPERIKFDTYKEMVKYYSEKIQTINHDERYDFLLSLLRYDVRFYNEAGEYLRSENKHQYLEDKYHYMLLPKFSRENARNLKYTI